MNSLFLDWEFKIRPEVERVSFLVSDPLSDEPSILVDQVSQAECNYARTGYLLAQANSWLEKAALHYLPPREEKTELERKTELTASLTPYREVRDRIKTILDAIEFRISLAQSILRTQNLLMERTVTVNKPRY